MSDKIIWDRVADLDVAIKGGDINLIEYRQAGGKGILQIFDNTQGETGKEAFFIVDALPRDVGRRAKDVADYLKINGLNVINGAISGQYFEPGTRPANFFDAEARRLINTTESPAEPVTGLSVSPEAIAVHTADLPPANNSGMPPSVKVHFALRDQFAHAAEFHAPEPAVAPAGAILHAQTGLSGGQSQKL